MYSQAQLPTTKFGTGRKASERVESHGSTRESVKAYASRGQYRFGAFGIPTPARNMRCLVAGQALMAGDPRAGRK